MREILHNVYFLENPSDGEERRAAYFVIRPFGNYLFHPVERHELVYRLFQSTGGVSKQILAGSEQLGRAAAQLFVVFGASAIFHSPGATGGTTEFPLKVEYLAEGDFWDPRLMPLPFYFQGKQRTWYILNHDKHRILFAGPELALEQGRWELAPAFHHCEGLRKVLEHVRKNPVDLFLPARFRGSDNFPFLTRLGRETEVDRILTAGFQGP